MGVGMCVCGAEVEERWSTLRLASGLHVLMGMAFCFFGNENERWCKYTTLRLNFGLHVLLGVPFYPLAGRKTLKRYMMYYLAPKAVPNLRLVIPSLHAVSVPSSDRYATTTQG